MNTKKLLLILNLALTSCFSNNDLTKYKNLEKTTIKNFEFDQSKRGRFVKWAKKNTPILLCSITVGVVGGFIPVILFDQFKWKKRDKENEEIKKRLKDLEKKLSGFRNNDDSDEIKIPESETSDEDREGPEDNSSFEEKDDDEVVVGLKRKVRRNIPKIIKRKPRSRQKRVTKKTRRKRVRRKRVTRKEKLPKKRVRSSENVGTINNDSTEGSVEDEPGEQEGVQPENTDNRWRIRKAWDATGGRAWNAISG